MIQPYCDSCGTASGPFVIWSDAIGSRRSSCGRCDAERQASLAAYQAALDQRMEIERQNIEKFGGDYCDNCGALATTPMIQYDQVGRSRMVCPRCDADRQAADRQHRTNRDQRVAILREQSERGRG